MNLVPGARLRDYEIKSLIGKGGMGEVYMAEDVILGRRVAVKQLLTHNATDPQHLQRFINEAKVQAQLNHPNIVELYSFFEEGGAYYLVMQFASGTTLGDIIRQNGPMPVNKALGIFAQLASALGHAHAKGVAHRDVKPSNIMVDGANGDHVKVMDFGIARMLTAQHITQTGTQMGTVYYMSPEQVLGKKDVDHRSDVYSAGVVLYEMLTGRLPFDMDTDSLYIVQERIVNTDLPDPRSLRADIGENVANLLSALTRKDREMRLNQLDEVAAAIRGGNSGLGSGPGSGIGSAWVHAGPQGSAYTEKPSFQHAPEATQTMVRPEGIPRSRPSIIPPAKDMPRQGKVIRSGSIDMLMVLGGSFLMGCDGPHENEGPVHQVVLSPFLMGVYPVTQSQWMKVMRVNPSHQRGPELPVDTVTWWDAIDYCNKMSLADGLQPCYNVLGKAITCAWEASGYRLPTEAEWEYAAQGGCNGRGYEFSGSNRLDEVGWYENNSGYKSHPVGLKTPNELGLHDMCGNMFEWCWDWLGPYPASLCRDPRGPEDGRFRIMRGGAWGSNEVMCRVVNRASGVPDAKAYRFFGLRLVRSYVG